ncbi:hypothetical protein [Streptomyces sp. CG 926]|uniref:hypothetical protein n=1 Tax=Streptomyces sp. CG 926 TaxID=1882405 RepID=UPI00215B2D77|nr:hypothetical protein [Streptomyces sp. CG 926]
MGGEGGEPGDGHGGAQDVEQLDGGGVEVEQAAVGVPVCGHGLQHGGLLAGAGVHRARARVGDCLGEFVFLTAAGPASFPVAGEVLGDPPGGVRAQRYGAADRAQPAVDVVATEDEELGRVRVPVIAPTIVSVVSLRRILLTLRRRGETGYSAGRSADAVRAAITSHTALLQPLLDEPTRNTDPHAACTLAPDADAGADRDCTFRAAFRTTQAAGDWGAGVGLFGRLRCEDDYRDGIAPHTDWRPGALLSAEQARKGPLFDRGSCATARAPPPSC